MENKRLWAVMFVLLAFTLAGCTSTESMGSFWLGDDGEISHDEKPVPVPRGSGLVYTPDSRDREYQQYVTVEPGYRDPLHHGFFPSRKSTFYDNSPSGRGDPFHYTPAQ